MRKIFVSIVLLEVVGMFGCFSGCCNVERLLSRASVCHIQCHGLFSCCGTMD